MVWPRRIFLLIMCLLIFFSLLVFEILIFPMPYQVQISISSAVGSTYIFGWSLICNDVCSSCFNGWGMYQVLEVLQYCVFYWLCVCIASLKYNSLALLSMLVSSLNMYLGPNVSSKALFESWQLLVYCSQLAHTRLHQDWQLPLLLLLMFWAGVLAGRWTR